MKNNNQSPEIQRFKEYISVLIKKYNYSKIETKAGLRKGFISDALNENSKRSTAKVHHNEKIFEAFREDLDPALNDETIKEKVVRMDQELEDLKKQFAEQQAIWDEKSKILEIAKALADQLGKENE